MRRIIRLRRTIRRTRIELARCRPWRCRLICRAGARLVVCRCRDHDRVTGSGEAVVKGTDVEFSPAVVVREDDVHGVGNGEEGGEDGKETHYDGDRRGDRRY